MFHEKFHGPSTRKMVDIPVNCGGEHKEMTTFYDKLVETALGESATGRQDTGWWKRKWKCGFGRTLLAGEKSPSLAAYKALRTVGSREEVSVQNKTTLPGYCNLQAEQLLCEGLKSISWRPVMLGPFRSQQAVEPTWI